MCGIGGIVYKSGKHPQRTGEVAHRILHCIYRRGRDSTGVALWQPDGHGLLYVGINYDRPGLGPEIVERLQARFAVRQVTDGNGFVRAVIEAPSDDAQLVDEIEAIDASVTVAAVGRHIEVLKSLGGVDNLEHSFHLRQYDGPMAIGLTRNATESRVDFCHAQPLSARGRRDLVIMHNGHITNYLALRDRYERLGYHFLTTNDSEVLSVLLAHQLNQGASFKEALTESIRIVDGAMTYVALTDREVGLVKDLWGYKPMVVAETDEAVVFASEGEAIVGGLETDIRYWEPGAGSVLTWQL